MPLSAGAATRVINPAIGDDLCGQLHRRYALSIHDDLEANFLFLADERARFLLINLDLIGLCAPGDIPALRETAAAAAGLEPRDVVISHTHTHDGPDLFGLAPGAPRNEAYVQALKGWLADGAAQAVQSARPAKVGHATGCAHVGFNRRLCWADGSHSMYGDPSRPDFAGLEGPDDPQHSLLAAYDLDGRLIALVHNNCCHATCIEAENAVSADFPGLARQRLRDRLGPIPVLYLQGASGDISPWDMTGPGFRDRFLRLREVGEALAAESLRLLQRLRPIPDAPLAHAWTLLPIPLRSLDEKTLAWASEVNAPNRQPDWSDALRQGVLRLAALCKENPLDQIPLHALRIGELAIATNPCEFYCQFGLDIKRRSRASVTMISQLTDGFAGYCPTLYAISGGGYSGDPTDWCRLDPTAGYQIVEATGKLLRTVLSS